MMIIYKSINEEFRKRLCNTLYYSSIAIFTLCVCLNCSYWGRRSEILGTIAYRVINYLRYGSYILCFLKICFQKHTFDKKFILKIVILAISTLCAFYVEERGLPMLVLLILGAEKMDSKIIAKIVLASQCLILVAASIASQTGLVPNDAEYHNGRIRHYMGFDWVTVAPILVFFIILELIYIYDGLLKWWHTLICLIVISYFYVQTKTRLVFMLSIIMIVLFFFAGYKINKKNISKIRVFKIWWIVPWIIAILTIGAGYMYKENALWMKVNSLVSGRFALANQALKAYPITLLGMKIKWLGGNVTEGYNYVDCSYIQVLLNYGIIFLCLLLVAYSLLIIKAIKNNNMVLLVIVISVLVFCASEPYLMNLMYNPFIYFIMAELSMKKSEKLHK